MYKPEYIKYFAGVSVFLFLMMIPFLMFNTDSYSKFMRISGFGGGKEISVFYKTMNKKTTQEHANGGLLIRTSKFIIVYEVENNIIIEIPISNIIKIVYKTSGEYSLPKKI